MASLEEKTYLTSEEIKDAKKQALEFLSSHYFYAASDIYKKLLENNPNDKEAHIGVLLCENKIDDEEKLIRYYRNLYSNEEYEIKLACEPDTDHIEEMCKKFYLPDYLEKEEIRKAYVFDLSYKSNVFSRKKQKEDIVKLIDQNEHLSWLKEKGFKEIFDIVGVYDKRLDDAQEKDKEDVLRIKSEYQRFLYKAYGDVKDLNRKAKEKKEEEYQSLVNQYDASKQENELRDLSYRFSRFKDYKDGEKYSNLCLKKIEDLRKEEKEKAFQTVIENTLNEAKSALVKEKYEDAYDGFSQAMSYDPDNEETYLGILMARTKTNDVDELFDYYKNLYGADQYETVEACEEDTDHIDEMADKYYLPEYLEKETIRQKYDFDRFYQSCLNSRIRQEKQFKDELEADPVFVWLKNNGSDKIRKKIKDVYDFYSLRIKEAEEEDHKRAERIKNDYQRFLFKTYSSIKNLHKRAANRKEESYRQLIKSFDLANTEEELKGLIAKLEDLGEYKECSRYIHLCHNKIEELKNKEEEAFAAQDVETTLIAAKAYLSSGNKDLATQNFEKVLSMDPDNPRAYLGILMLETGSKDIDELVRYYQNLYNEDETQVISGCEEKSDHIDQMVERYRIPGYLSDDAIRRYYVFDRNFESLTASRIEQRDQFNEEIRMNPLFSKISSSTDEEIVSFLDRVRGEYEARIVESKAADERQRESINHIYDVYLSESDKTVQRIYEEKLKEKQRDDEALYLRNVEQFNKDLSEEELLELSERFDLDYKDGSVYAKKCRERISEIRREREKEKLETLMVNGTALLESGLFPQAKERFESYLNIDPENEEAHLKLLMAEKKVSDIDALFAYYKDLYSEEIFETKEAVEENSEHIEEVCERCYVPELLQKEEIQKRYEFDRTYESLLDSRVEQRKQIEDEIELDPVLNWLNENGSAKTMAYIDDLIDAYDQRVNEAKDEDEYLAKTTEKEYRSFIRNTDREIRSLYSELNRELNKRIKEAEKERKETERQLKEEAERKRTLELEEARRKQELAEELERRNREEQEALRKKQEADEIAAQAERRQEEIALKKLQEEERKDQKAVLEKERLNQKAQAKADKERQKEEKRRQADEKKRLKEETKRKAKEEKQARKQEKEITSAQKSAAKSSFGANIGLIMAGLSLILLGTLIFIFVLTPNRKYNNAMKLADAGNYDEAISIYTELGDYKDSAFKVKETIYKKADSLYKNNEIVEAANIFNNLRFDDSEERLKQIKEEMINNARVGDTILFGDYEQDGNTENGKEMIEWTVLDRQEGSIFVVSKYGIEAQRFNPNQEETYWENSSLRSWLNGRFPDNSFSREDPADVLSTTLINYRYPEQENEEEDISELILEEYETRDRIFLLSFEEVEQYFPQEDSRSCKATELAIENGVAANADNGCNWWLRSPGNERGTAQYVQNQYGTIESSLQDEMMAVRPAMWIMAE